MVVKNCDRCGVVIKCGNSRKYCDKCIPIVKKEREKKWNEKRRGNRKEYHKKWHKKRKSKLVKKDIKCNLCKCIINDGGRKYCVRCREIARKERTNKYNEKNKKKRKTVKLCHMCGVLIDIDGKNHKYCKRCKKISHNKNTKKWYIKNKKKHRESQRINNLKPESIKKRRNREKIKNRTDIQYNLTKRIRCRFRGAVRKYIDKDQIIISKNKNINYLEIINRLKPTMKKVKNYDIDHIIPLDFFDLTNDEQLKKACDPINFQWLEKSKNVSKSNKIDFDKYPEQKEVWEKLELDKIKPKGLYTQDY